MGGNNGARQTLTPAGYRSRIAEKDAERALGTARALLIEGPKGCGKTWLAKHLARSEVLLEHDPAARALAEAEPHRVLEGPVPRLLDEWQLVPALWGAVRGTGDARGLPGQFILTGSATPADDLTRHSGALRIRRLALRTMSLAERGWSTREVSLAGLLRGDAVAAGRTGRGVPEAVDALCRGGWPGFDDSVPTAHIVDALRSYLAAMARTDIRQVDGVARDPVRVRALLRSVARNVSTAANLNKLASEASPGASLGRHSVRAYLDALEMLHVLEPLTVWPTHLRSRSPLLKSPKHHFSDPSLAVAALRASPERLLADPEACGLLFESLVIRDLRVYAQAAGAEVFAFGDVGGTEADAIVDGGDGRWLAVEVKLGGSKQIEQAARSLLSVKGKVDETKMGAASKLLVVTAADGYSYERPDGVAVAPMSALGP